MNKPTKEMLNRAVERRFHAMLAPDCLDFLIEAMQNKTGQGYKLRGLLYSLWNGQPYPLIEVLCLDWELRVALGEVMLAFGFETPGTSFFYKELREAIEKAGLWAWFLEEGETP